MHRPQVVTRVAQWQGWCTPCQSEERPLVLTRSGPGGVRSWLAGLGDDDRTLLLTCVVCGDWQVVPAREDDDPEVLLVEDEVTVEVVLPEFVPVEVVLPEVVPVEVVLVPDGRADVTARLGAGLSALLATRTTAALPAPREPARPALRVVRGGADPASVALPSSDPLALVHLAAVGS